MSSTDLTTNYWSSLRNNEGHRTCGQWCCLLLQTAFVSVSIVTLITSIRQVLYSYQTLLRDRVTRPPSFAFSYNFPSFYKTIELTLDRLFTNVRYYL